MSYPVGPAASSAATRKVADCREGRVIRRLSTSVTGRAGNESDEALIRAIQSGDSESFGVLVNRHDSVVRRTVRRSVTDPTNLEDAVQETWFQAYRKVGDLVSPSKVKSWLVSIARHCAQDQWRRGSLRATKPLEADPAVGEGAGTDDWLWQLVERLPVSFAEVLLLHYRDGRSYDDIAGRLGIPPSTVRGRIYAARQELKNRLGREEE